MACISRPYLSHAKQDVELERKYNGADLHINHKVDIFVYDGNKIVSVTRSMKNQSYTE
jgi:hypothetical protein